MKLAYNAAVEFELPTQTSVNNLELRLLPYWKGVKQYRAKQLHQHIQPQAYYQSILASNDNPTVASGNIVGNYTRADMYFSRLPEAIKLKLWNNFQGSFMPVVSKSSGWHK